ncbi:hypothetical protein CERZMDRAFT_103357 [Cercospora zeae-maydis SCOH1-5]|uniref:Uncharacterized protein n=1 Tax=Cercospora zeae-maydis SCOH1-5 TaxID=717836 RepID=A0A6A6EZC3_9PEZI|nr:hypothetical protein CERZMDRAFT_103357 [Cercospora zeae-maydis SCOH1-5]
MPPLQGRGRLPRAASARRDNFNANRQGGTPDLFVNTSLEDGRDRRDVRAPPQMAPRLTREQVAEIERYEDAVEEYTLAMEERAQQEAADKPKQDKIDKIDDARREHHMHERPLLTTFTSAVQHWQKETPDDAAQFMEHYREANLASTEPVRVYDMMSWYPNPPAPVSKAIEALQAFYHRQVSFDYEIQLLEEKLARASWPMHGLHAEVYHAYRHDRLAAKQDGKEFQAFGFDKKHLDLTKFEENLEKLTEVDAPGVEARRVLSIRANFRVRRTLLEGTSPGATHHDGRRPRYDPSNAVKFRHSAEWALIQWAKEAAYVTTYILLPKYTGKVAPDVLDLLNSTEIEIREYITKIDVIGLCELNGVLWATFSNSFDALRRHLADMERNGADTAAQRRFAEMKKDIRQMMLTFEQFEAKHGRGLLHNHWRYLQNLTHKLLETAAPPAPWTDADDAEYLARSGHPDDGWADSSDDEEEQLEIPSQQEA